MKKFLMLAILFIIFLCCVNVFAEEKVKLDGFLGVPWGANPEQVETIISQREGTVKYKVYPDFTVYKGDFIGEESELVFYFYNNQMWQAVVFMTDISEGRIIDKWKTIKQQITDKYGPPKSDFFFFKSPYRNGDGFETQAIRLEKGTATTFWFFPSEPGKKDNSITCEISKNLEIVVKYQNGELARQYITNRDKNNSNDL